MKKWSCVLAAILLTAALCGCSPAPTEPPKEQWDCTVACAKESADNSYVITYSEEEIISNTGVLTLHNQNDFPITVHLMRNGAQEITYEVEAGELAVCSELETDAVYTIGIHADVAENTEIKLMVYDGQRAEGT